MMADPFLGEIRVFGFNFAPSGWAKCDGQTLSVMQYSALYTLLGTNYGGDGVNNFCLPDLRSRVPIQPDSMGGVGQKNGLEQVTLTVDSMPAHNHIVMATNSAANSADPTSNLLARSSYAGQELLLYDVPNEDLSIKEETIGSAGGNYSHSNIQPCIAVNFCIALAGVYPSRS